MRLFQITSFLTRSVLSYKANTSTQPSIHILNSVDHKRQRIGPYQLLNASTASEWRESWWFYIKTNIQSKLMNTTTMNPYGRTS